MFKYEKTCIPRCFTGTFIKNKQVHKYNTRFAHHYRTVKHKSNIVKYSIKVIGPKIWKDIPLELQNSKSLNIFKKSMKLLLLSQYNQ